MESRILRAEIEVTTALAELGLTVEQLRDAICAGEMARDECTPNDPLAAPGFLSYTMTTRRLAEILNPEGWTREDVDSLALIMSPTRELAVVVSSGNEGTGTTFPVRTKYPKGPATVAAVQRNLQTELFPQFSRKPEPQTWQTWILLRRRSGDTLYSELSLPSGLDDAGHVVEWTRRIILDPISFTPSIDDDTNYDDDGIVIDIPRR